MTGSKMDDFFSLLRAIALKAPLPLTGLDALNTILWICQLAEDLWITLNEDSLARWPERLQTLEKRPDEEGLIEVGCTSVRLGISEWDVLNVGDIRRKGRLSWRRSSLKRRSLKGNCQHDSFLFFTVVQDRSIHSSWILSPSVMRRGKAWRSAREAKCPDRGTVLVDHLTLTGTPYSKMLGRYSSTEDHNGIGANAMDIEVPRPSSS
ncbi:hypothetical protein DFS33DRAFT_1271181 [Desarmillaria ectypa]|nr:hypothetical protein DFS33DRAFT_1271181 [Desarmillaria ectypa]